MRQIARQHPGHQIAGAIVFGAVGNGNGPALACEPGLQIRHATMVDVAVRRTQAPVLRIFREVRAHVLVDQPLQIHALGAKRADHHIGTHAARNGHIPTGVGDARVSRVVVDGHADLLPRRADQCARRRRGRGWVASGRRRSTRRLRAGIDATAHCAQQRSGQCDLPPTARKCCAAHQSCGPGTATSRPGTCTIRSSSVSSCSAVSLPPQTAPVSIACTPWPMNRPSVDQ